MVQESKETDYEDAVLSTLAYEFSLTDRRETETKIKRKLRTKKFGKYDQHRVDLLRRFKDEVQTEVSRGQKSKYYTHPHSEFSDMRDFDKEALAKEMAAAFPDIPEPSISQFIDFAIYLYYLR